MTFPSFPDRLRIVDGELKMADGSDLQAYLRAWAERNKVNPDTPVTLLTRETATAHYWMNGSA